MTKSQHLWRPGHLWRRPGRWLRRTGWLLGQARADFGFGTAGGPVWLRDNPFLLKTGRAETRRLGLGWRVLAAVLVLGGLLLGGLTAQRVYPGAAGFAAGLIFGAPFPVVLFVAVSFAHTLLIGNARAATATPLAEEARRGTLPDLLLSPLRRAEMLLAMGVGPARSALLVALAGLPVYALLGQFGGPAAREVACLYLLFALLSFQPPAYAFPALSGLAPTPDAPPGQFAPAPNRRAVRRTGYLAGFPLLLGLLFFGQTLGLLGGGWLAHLSSALHLPLRSGFSFLLFLSWPYYAVRLLSGRLPFFHFFLSPLWYVLPLTALHWAGSALASASALSAGDSGDMRRLPLWTRAQTALRWTARAAGLCALGVVWTAWVGSGDTAALAGGYVSGPGWDAAGLLLLLGGLSLPNVCARALAVDSRRSPALSLRRALKRSLRPLGVAGGMFLAACALGRLSPLAAPVYQTAGQIAAAGISTVFWAVGVRRALPGASRWTAGVLLYAVPLFALSVPGFGLLAALSPAAAWVRLFHGGPALVARFPFWHLGTLPSLWVCAAGPLLAGLALMAAAQRPKRQARAAPAPSAAAKRVPARNGGRTAALMAWITARTDNPLFTYELRARTRSGRWFDWVCYAPLAVAAGVAVALAYPSVMAGFSFLSPFHFFPAGASPSASLAALLLLGQCYILSIRGPVMGEMLIAKDRQQGTWGFLLLTPLTVREIFWGKVFGQTTALGAVWAVMALICLALYGLAAPVVGVGPALTAWGTSQLFVAGLFVLGISLGAALAAFPKVQKTLRGLSTLLFVLVVGGSVYAEFQWVPEGWSLPLRLSLGGLYALALAAALFWLAQWRLSLLRRRDVAFGDGTE